MKISELIKVLETVQMNAGDIEVVLIKEDTSSGEVVFSNLLHLELVEHGDFYDDEMYEAIGDLFNHKRSDEVFLIL